MKIDALIEKLFPGRTLEGIRSVSGGDINEAFLVILSDGKKVFAKSNRRRSEDFFKAEEGGLKALSSVGVIGVPEVIFTGSDDDGIPVLIMKYIGSAGRVSDYWETLGRELAALHSAEPRPELMDRDKPFGFLSDNYIGSSVQKNTPKRTWLEFYREMRLEVQFRMAEDKLGSEGLKMAGNLLDKLDKYISEPTRPSLLHGDLWGGNVITGHDGKAWLIDPAVYIGHPEADMAMTELFGGFHPAFYGAYREVFPVDNEYSVRRDLYQLYQLLNHLNLFGGGYYGSVMNILSHYA